METPAPDKPFPGGAVGRLAVGGALTTLGVVGLVMPIMPGWAFLVPGLGIMAPVVPPLRPVHRKAMEVFEKVDPSRAARARRRDARDTESD